MYTDVLGTQVYKDVLGAEEYTGVQMDTYEQLHCTRRRCRRLSCVCVYTRATSVDDQ